MRTQKNSFTHFLILGTMVDDNFRHFNIHHFEMTCWGSVHVIDAVTLALAGHSLWGGGRAVLSWSGLGEMACVGPFAKALEMTHWCISIQKSMPFRKQ